MRHLILITCILLAAGLTVGCQTTAPPPATSAEAPAVDPLAQWEANATLAASLGTAAYLSQRDHMDTKAREAVRVGWLAFDTTIYAAAANGVALGDPATALAAAVTERVPVVYQPLARELVTQIVIRLRARVPLDQLSDEQAWRIAIAVHRGIAIQLQLHGIDPTRPVSEVT